MPSLHPEHDLLHKVLAVNLTERYVYSASVYMAGFFVIPGNNAPRWLLPKNSGLARRRPGWTLPGRCSSQAAAWR